MAGLPTGTGAETALSTPPTGTVTFLFTDIEGSTRTWEQQRPLMEQAFARQETILHAAISANKGYAYKQVGDAFQAAFSTAHDALLASLSAQHALLSEPWPPALGPLRVRMALHTGITQERGNDYVGPSLNRVARLLSAGHGGQVLLTQATAQLVQDDLPAGVDLLDLGEHWLKDLLRPEHIFQLVAPDAPWGLPTDFPPLDTLDAPSPPANLPSSSNTSGVGPTAPLAVENPYKGLRAFQEKDAQDFYGREELTQRLVERLAEPGSFSRFLAVVGPSGSGKSSVVRAGLIPRLKQGGEGALVGSNRWQVVEVIPGAQPLEEIETALLRIAVNPPESLINQLKEDERGLARAIKRVLPSDEDVELVMVLDQFEEVFTLIPDEPARVHFLRSLYVALTDPRSRLRVIVTLRADFYDRPLFYPDPGKLVRQRTEVVLPMSVEEIERAIVRPARRVGVQVEEELVAAIVRDVGEQPGRLPLLEYALTEVFDRRQGRKMTLASYRAIGGVPGALSRRTEELYGGLSGEAQELARQVFLRLVTPGEGTEDTRRRVKLSELETLSGDRTRLDGVLETFGHYRLLTFDRDPVTGTPVVEVAHEALLRTWPRLRDWLEESRGAVKLQRQLTAASAEWEGSSRDPSFLATGSRLAQFEGLSEGAGSPGGVVLTSEEKEYLSASRGERERQQTLERERQARELELQKQAASRLRVLVAGMAVFLVIVGGLALFALGKQAEADTQRAAAENNAALANSEKQAAQNNAATAVAVQNQAQADFRRAEAQRLAAEANYVAVQRGNVDLIALLSIRSLQVEYSPQGDAALGAAAPLDYPLRMFSGHTDEVWGVAISPDGRYVATGSMDGTARLWDLASGAEVHRFTGHTAGLSGLEFAPDGRTLLTIATDGTARLWDVATGRQLHTFSHPGTVLGAAFAGDGRIIATGSTDKTARIWDLESGAEMRRITQQHTVSGVALSPDGRLLATSSFDEPVARLWDVASGTMLREFTGHQAGVLRVGFSPDGRTLVTASNDKTARLWDVATGALLRTFAGHDNVLFSTAFSPDGRTLLTTSQDGTARLWDVATGKEMRRLVGHTGTVYDGAYSADGRYVVTGGADATALLWSTTPSPILPEFVGHTDLINTQDVAFSPDGKWLLTGSSDRTLRLWNAQTGQEVRRFTGHGGPVVSVRFSPDGRYALSASDDATLRLWDVATGQEVRRFTGHDAGVLVAVFSPDGKWILSGSSDQTARLWDARSGKEIWRFTLHTNDAMWDVAFSPDGKTALTASGDKTARLLDAATGRELRQFTGHTGIVTSVAFSPDGKWAVTGSDDTTARLWDLATGQELRRFVGHTGGVWSVAFSPVGKTLLTGGTTDRTARLWDVSTGAELRRFVGHAGSVLGVAFSPDGREVLTSSSDQTARLWYVDYRDTIAALCARLLRDFTPAERAAYEIKDNQPTCPGH